MDFLPRRRQAVNQLPAAALCTESKTTEDRHGQTHTHSLVGTTKLACNEDLRTLTRTVSPHALIPQKNKKSLTVAKSSGCADRTVIDIDVLSYSES